MAVWMLLLCLAVVELASAKQFIIRNNCRYSILVGIAGNPGFGQPKNGGFRLNKGEERKIGIDDDWIGRVWPRTRCDGNGHCQTGDCGGVQCAGTINQTPATLANFVLDSGSGDWYDVSLVDGFNVGVTIIPTNGSCQTVQCSADLVPGCPNRLKTSKGHACRNDDSEEARNYCNSHCNTAKCFLDDDSKVLHCSNTDYRINIC